ncbi:haloacid dehalogenase-like hydrolase [Sphingomonas aurantiaca]|uniref:Haloacid dehalogenase-like hydrolase n=1 Tax=Sphingomonas aurantiaca TaxID=185949 RepID=A0A2T5GIZ8_9SPHN|nr:haloacid dehalogenase-like hydrolase [Sphingomonas aurantiaca]
MTDTILACDLATALDARPDLRVLSLDCFDTLLWRDTHAPQDVFGALGAPNPQQRVWAEQRARGTAALRRRRNEVGIAEIYAELAPNATAEARAAMVAHELATEAHHCFGFAPVIALMQAARARGLMVIIVSDTYLDKQQLGALIATAAGDDVRALIDRIFCSSEYGVSKGEGLIGKVVAELQLRRETVLHIGDNRAADLIAGQKAGVRALHLKQFCASTEQRLRLEAATSAMIHAGGPNAQPHRASIAIAEPGIDDPAERLGYTTIGPVLRGFADWIAQEAAMLRASSGHRVHVLFLMRDGHLPKLVQDAVAPDADAHAIEISRFTATAATLASEADVTRYLEGDPLPARLQRLVEDRHHGRRDAAGNERAEAVIGSCDDRVGAPAHPALPRTRGKTGGETRACR